MYGETIADERESVILPWERPAKSTANDCVYLITDGATAKIGFTGNLPVRFSTLRHGTHRKLCMARAVFTQHAVRLEHVMHGLLASKHVHGEWFKLTPDEWDAMLPQALAIATS